MKILKELLRTFSPADNTHTGEIGCLVETGTTLEISRYSSESTNEGEMFFLDKSPIFLVPQKCGQAAAHLQTLHSQGQTQAGMWAVVDANGSIVHFESLAEANSYAASTGLNDDSCCIEYISL